MISERVTRRSATSSGCRRTRSRSPDRSLRTGAARASSPRRCARPDAYSLPNELLAVGHCRPDIRLDIRLKLAIVVAVVVQPFVQQVVDANVADLLVGATASEVSLRQTLD